MNIYATLHTAPSKRNHAHEMIYITRGASAELIYPLYDKVFRFEDIEQVTFTFKQGKNLQWYTMFAADGTTDSHFYHFDNEDYAAIIFNLDSEETKQFKPGVNIEYEVAIKLNTDSYASLSNKDSIIIESQHPIAVVDSLYSRV
jgi:hypothetical protein